MKTRILLADDHQMFRHALRLMLERDPAMVIAGEASDGLELLRVAAERPADVACIDIAMPRMNGIEATRRLLSLNPGIRVIGLSAMTDRDFVLDMLKAGAAGYVSKGESGEELLRAIRAVRANRKYLCPEVAATVTGALLDNDDGPMATPRLGSRERQVLQLVADGNTSVKIAERLHLASSTVEVHRRNIMRKLNLHNIAELTKYAIRNGLTTSSTPPNGN